MPESKNRPILRCNTCHKVIKTQVWRWGDSIGIYCSERCLLNQAFINVQSVDQVLEDDKVAIAQEAIFGEK